MSDCCKIYITGSRPKGAHGIQSLALEVPLKSATRARRIVIQNHRVCCKGIIQGCGDEGTASLACQLMRFVPHHILLLLKSCHVLTTFNWQETIFSFFQCSMPRR